jgi:hypothetical protein
LLDSECSSLLAETATAVAVRIGRSTLIEIIAPYGLDDLFERRLRATPFFESDKRDVFWQRVVAKRWLERYPDLQLILPIVWAWG